ncbi:hypothetical protein [Allokutzneria sp. NRRL B-24872]|uniref:hypothetical protein n=1 Tax=Allokutzneria sp. NRRL B-24872 TaxID=1137961 RepID=UPI000A3A7643|nr:hypothetical protein [Allokutzneria sp. NRRL B-24872]
MDHDDARASLAEAQRLAGVARVAAGWYSRFLVLFGISSFVVAASFAVVDRMTAVAVITPIWLVLVLGLTIVVVLRSRSSVRGYASIHGAVMAVWSAAWVLTMALTTPTSASWLPLLGGAVMAIAAFVGAYVAHRRSRA